jgi:predicted transcriptional regulator
MEHLHFLRQRRRELGLSQNDLELRLKHRGVNLSRKVISAWERGQLHPQLNKGELGALADALRWDEDQLRNALNGNR